MRPRQSRVETTSMPVNNKRQSAQTPSKRGPKSSVTYKCTGCTSKIKTSYQAAIHPLIDCLMCRKCRITYNNGDFTQFEDGVDERGDDNFCRWCLDGGTLYGCGQNNNENEEPEDDSADRCHYSFCQECIKRNVPDDPVLRADDQDFKWTCYACDKSRISHLIEDAKVAMEDLISRARNSTKKVKMDDNSEPKRPTRTSVPVFETKKTSTSSSSKSDSTATMTKSVDSPKTNRGLKLGFTPSFNKEPTRVSEQAKVPATAKTVSPPSNVTSIKEPEKASTSPSKPEISKPTEAPKQQQAPVPPVATPTVAPATAPTSTAAPATAPTPPTIQPTIPVFKPNETPAKTVITPKTPATAKLNPKQSDMCSIPEPDKQSTSKVDAATTKVNEQPTRPAVAILKPPNSLNTKLDTPSKPITSAPSEPTPSKIPEKKGATLYGSSSLARQRMSVINPEAAATRPRPSSESDIDQRIEFMMKNKDSSIEELNTKLSHIGELFKFVFKDPAPNKLQALETEIESIRRPIREIEDITVELKRLCNSLAATK